MEICDDVLEEGKSELTLDRPPVAGSGGTIGLLSSSPKSLSSHLHEENVLLNVEIDSTNSNIEGTSGLGPLEDKFHPLSSSERKLSEESEDKYLTTTGPNNTEKEMGNSRNNFFPATNSETLMAIGTVQQNINLTKKTERKRTRYQNSKQPLISCLKKSSEKKTQTESKKSVKFHDSQDCVREYIDPVDPWRDVRTPSKAEVVSFYRNSCQKLRCKPLEKVIKQIQNIPDLSVRADTLILRGIRLDVKSCEAMESVFRRVQFENLDLENCSLEEDAATSILEMIEFYHSTCKLNIACNPKIGMRGWQSLCRMLRKTQILTYLDARRTLLTNLTMPTFGRCLKADPNLKILHLEGVFLSGRPLLILTTAMKYNKILEELYLGDNDLSSSDGPPIGAMLTYNTTLQLLDLRNNQMKDIGLAHVGNGLSDQSEQLCGGLCSLIMWNNGLTHEGMGYLCEGLIQTTSLKALNLGQNRIGDLGLQKLKNGLIKNKSLRKLGFLNTKLGSEGAVALAEVLADSLTITRIDIRENNIQTAGLMAFSMALKVNQSLLRLDLDKDMKKEPGMESVMQTVLVDIYNLCHRNKQLARKTLSSSSSSISSEIVPTTSQQSTSTEINDFIICDDIFHPEASQLEITPFSPVEYPDGLVILPDHFSFKNDTNESDPVVNREIITTESLGNSVASVFEPAKRNRSQSDPAGKKNPDPAPQPSRRPSRFSVTKILDTIATNVANIDNRLKRQLSKEKIDVKPSSEVMPVLEQKENPEKAPSSNVKNSPIIPADTLNTSNNINFEILDNHFANTHSSDNESNENDTDDNTQQPQILRTQSAPNRIAAGSTDGPAISDEVKSVIKCLISEKSVENTAYILESMQNIGNDSKTDELNEMKSKTIQQNNLVDSSTNHNLQDVDKIKSDSTSTNDTKVQSSNTYDDCITIESEVLKENKLSCFSASAQSSASALLNSTEKTLQDCLNSKNQSNLNVEDKLNEQGKSNLQLDSCSDQYKDKGDLLEKNDIEGSSYYDSSSMQQHIADSELSFEMNNSQPVIPDELCSTTAAHTNQPIALDLTT